MKRDLKLLASNQWDVLIVGGGIYGACIAWDAALRGLSVALVEKGEFGQATSANSLKIIHGGLRYLQEANLRRMRLMVRERRAWLRIAPHLIKPLPFILPTQTNFSRSRALLSLALIINDLISLDRNRGVNRANYVPRGRLLSQNEFLTFVPGMLPNGLTGGAMWYDAQVIDTEQLLFSILRSAIMQGAAAINFAAVTGFLQKGNQITGVTVKDEFSGQEFSMKARLVINCAGAWCDRLLALVKGHSITPTFHLSTAVNLVTRQLLPDVAVGLPSQYKGRSQILFLIPWQNYSLIGTWHAAHKSHIPDYQIDEGIITDCLDEINAIYPPAQLTRKDVCQVHYGYLPAKPSPDGKVELIRESQLHDHAHRDELQGLITVTGVKYTTARYTAERVVDLALHKLNRPFVPGQTSHTSLSQEST